jgi:hypothetical protein
MPVRVKKMRKNKNLEHFHVSTKRENAPSRISEKWPPAFGQKSCSDKRISTNIRWLAKECLLSA